MANKMYRAGVEMTLSPDQKVAIVQRDQFIRVTFLTSDDQEIPLTRGGGRSNHIDLVGVTHLDQVIDLIEVVTERTLTLFEEISNVTYYKVS